MNKKTSDNLKEIILQTRAGSISKQDFRSRIVKFEKQIKEYDKSAVRTSYKKNDAIDTFNGANLEHEFGEGTYIRKITMKKNSVIVSAIHLVEHPFFVMTGEATIVSSKGLTTIKAPHFGMTKPGTQRLLYINEDCVWITVHATDKTNVEEIVNDVISKDYNHDKLKIK